MDAQLGLARKTVRLVSYDQGWDIAFQRESAILHHHLGSVLVAIEHIGSTSIPGMEAKPVLDMMVAVCALRAPQSLYVKLGEIGYEHRPLDIVGDRLFFAKGPHEFRTHYLSVCEPNSRTWLQHIAFRDALRADFSLASEYARLKRSLAERFANDRESYTRGKASFIAGIVGE